MPHLALSKNGHLMYGGPGPGKHLLLGPCCCPKPCSAKCGGPTPSFTVTLSGVSLDTGCLENFLGSGVENDPGTTITGGTINGTYTLTPYTPPGGAHPDRNVLLAGNNNGPDLFPLLGCRDSAMHHARR